MLTRSVFSGLCQTSETQPFTKIVNGWKPFGILAISFLLRCFNGLWIRLCRVFLENISIHTKINSVKHTSSGVHFFLKLRFLNLILITLISPNFFSLKQIFFFEKLYAYLFPWVATVYGRKYTVKPLNSGQLRVLGNLPIIERCPLLGSNLRNIVTFGTERFVPYSWHVRYLGGFTVLRCSDKNLFWNVGKNPSNACGVEKSVFWKATN